MTSEKSEQSSQAEPIEFDAKSFENNHPSLYGQEQAFTFYYDETNNIRKLLLTEDGLNVKKHDNFVLGGVFLKEGQSLADIEELREILRIQKTAEEIKFDLVAKGDFEKVLTSKKLGLALSWLLKNDIGIHYSNLNILNWSVLDIIESIVSDDRFHPYLLINREIKNEFYKIISSDLSRFLSLLSSYSYPNIQPEKTSKFIEEINQFIERNWPQSANHVTEMMRGLLRQAQSASFSELPFLINETPNHLIENFSTFFLNRICTFRNSTHIFDEEKVIEGIIGDYKILNEGTAIPFSFVDSKDHGGIQLSDIVVGFLGKYFTFIEQNSLPVLLRKKKEMDQIQLKNLSLLADLIDVSDRVSNALLFRITTLDSDWKSDTFLHGAKPPPHLLAN